MSARPKCVFVTVGSTKFDDLAQTEQISPAVLDALHARQFRRLVFQCGNSDIKGHVQGSAMADEWNWRDEERDIDISVWRFSPELGKCFQEADLVISHAGSGTILEVLRLPKPLIVVPNETLLDNHQVELADALSELGHLLSATPRTLAKTIATYDETALIEFPQFDSSKFSAIMDEEMGFANFESADDAEKFERAARPQGPRNPEGARFSANSFVPPKSTGDIRLWRHDEHGNVWTKGSRTRCVGRFCCCTIMTTVLLIVSIVLTLGLWVRPPDISFNGIKTPTNGSTVEAQTTGILINLNLAIGVVNPNFFAADFSSIQAKAFYPGVTEQIGGGVLENINFPSHSDTTFLFPFSINYTEAIDPNKKIIQDIAVKCGFIGNSKSDIPVNYSLTLKLKIAGVTVSPSFSGSASFSCPLKASDISVSHCDCVANGN
ncbi:hypothetical protein RSAG8_00337, partial [Rhizoctonia solani AG-8 WAC10335]